MRKLLVLVLLLAFLGSVSGTRINSTIAKSCPTNYEPVISMAAPNGTYSNPGHPARYEHDLCVEGIEEAKIGNNCEGTAGFYLSSNDSTAHFSKFESYNMRVCTDRMVTQVRDSCMDNQTALFSVTDEHNSHVGWLDTFDKKVCGFYAPPENVSVSLEFNLSSSDTVHVDGEEAETGEYRFTEFPYIVSESDRYVSGLVSSSMIRVERELDGENRLLMEREAEKGSFLVPFTYGEHETIDDHQELILQGNFQDRLSASFGFFIPEEATVRTVLDPNASIDSFISLEPGTHTIRIVKSGENEVRVERE